MGTWVVKWLSTRRILWDVLWKVRFGACAPGARSESMHGGDVLC